jgi:hypothetical protein
MQAGVKFIMIMFVCMNLMTLFFSVGCTNIGGSSCPASNNVMLTLFFGSQAFNNVLGQGGLSLNSTLQTQVGDMTNEQTVGSIGQTVGTAFNLLDGLKMILGMLALLTPLPLLFFANSVGLPLFISVSFFGVAVLVWIIGIMEFIRGAKL